MPVSTDDNPIRRNAIPIELGNPKKSYDALLDAVGDSDFVLIGDGTHGTAEFYRERAYITQRLIMEKGFKVVAVEADWPDSYRINRYVKGCKADKTAAQALGNFKRFPLWMWRNAVMVPFIEWMRAYNRGRPSQEKATFHGLDMFSLHKSAETVVKYLENIDPKAAEKARQRYACFDKFGPDTMQYALFTGYGMQRSCEKEVCKVLTDLLNDGYAKVNNGLNDEEDGPEEKKWVTMMNALVVKDAEMYYRNMLEEDVKTWNIRDTHMIKVLEEVTKHHAGPDGKPAKAVVWAHNSHLGDARATDMGGRRGEVNVGQLTREKWGEDRVYNIGYLANIGTVTAADEWDEPAQLMRLNPALPESVEKTLEDACARDMKNFMLIIKRKEEKDGKWVKTDVDEDLTRRLRQPRLERYVGVLYKADTERWSHYSKSSLSQQFDAAVYIHESSGLKPLDKTNHFKDADENVPDTFPFAL